MSKNPFSVLTGMTSAEPLIIVSTMMASYTEDSPGRLRIIIHNPEVARARTTKGARGSRGRGWRGNQQQPFDKAESATSAPQGHVGQAETYVPRKEDPRPSQWEEREILKKRLEHSDRDSLIDLPSPHLAQLHSQGKERTRPEESNARLCHEGGQPRKEKEINLKGRRHGRHDSKDGNSNGAASNITRGIKGINNHKPSTLVDIWANWISTPSSIKP